MLSAPSRLMSDPGVIDDKVQSTVIPVTLVVGIPPREAMTCGFKSDPQTGSSRRVHSIPVPVIVDSTILHLL